MRSRVDYLREIGEQNATTDRDGRAVASGTI